MNKILIVEDEFIIADDLRECLQSFGYEVVGIASSGEAAIKKVEELRPNLVLMDIVLHGNMDGIEASHAIYQKFNTRVVFLTSFSDDHILERAKLAGPLGYVTKPFDKKELRIVLEMAFYKARSENEIYENKVLLRSILDNIGDAVVAVNDQGKVLFYNNLAQKLSGWSESDIKEKNIGDLAELQTRETKTREEIPFSLVIESGINREAQTHIFQTKKGKELIIEDNWTPLRNSENKITSAIWAFRDITQREKAMEERLKIEDKMQQVQRMDGLGFLTGGIAHDFNNIITLISLQATLIQSENGNKSQIDANVESILLAAQRAADLSAQLLAYTGTGKFQIQKVNLPPLVEEIAKLLMLPSDINVLYNIEKDVPPITADITKTRQIILNLLVNAFDAIKEGGKSIKEISIDIGTQKCTREYLDDTFMGTDLPPGSYLYMEVADNGIGMDRETREKIFNLFFTTKQRGHGLGMAAVLAIIRGQKGAIKVISEFQQGTQIRVLFPIT